MGLINKPYTFFPLTVIRSAEVNADFDVVYGEFNGNISDDNVSATAGIQFSKLQALPSAQILVGSAANVATPRTMSGDATISNTGVVTVNGSSVNFLLPAPNPPTAYRQIALVGPSGNSAVVQVHDGVSAKTYLRTDVYTEAVWDGGAIFNLGVAIDGAFVDVAAGAQIVQNVSVPGRYLVTFEFNYSVNVSSGRSASAFVYFRLTDGATNKKPIKVGYAADETLTAGSSSEQTITLVEVFNFITTGNKTIKLQKQNFTNLPAVDGTRAIEAINNVSLEMKVMRIAD